MQHKRISKFLSLVLRHKPETIGIQLDEQGWVDVQVLLAALAGHNRSITLSELEEVVATNEKQRFALVDGRIRANQGHSIVVSLDLEPLQPPETLFHGTATRFLDAIMEAGLLKMGRQHVHLSADTATAAKVGVRHGKLVILEVAAGELAANGATFYRSENGVWLVEHVPPEFLRRR